MNYIATAASFVGAHELSLIRRPAQKAIVTSILRDIQNLGADALQMLAYLAVPTLTNYLPQNIHVDAFEATDEQIVEQPLPDYKRNLDDLPFADWDATAETLRD